LVVSKRTAYGEGAARNYNLGVAGTHGGTEGTWLLELVHLGSDGDYGKLLASDRDDRLGGFALGVTAQYTSTRCRRVNGSGNTLQWNPAVCVKNTAKSALPELSLIKGCYRVFSRSQDFLLHWSWRLNTATV
jgi:hypothetical protein